MNAKKENTRKLLLASALLSLSAICHQALADDMPTPPGADCHGGPMHRPEMGGMDFPRGREMLERELSSDQIRILMEARLIMKGNPNLQVGDIKTTASGFSVNIVTKDKSLVETLELAKNGLPKDLADHMQERMQSKDKGDKPGKQ